MTEKQERVKEDRGRCDCDAQCSLNTERYTVAGKHGMIPAKQSTGKTRRKEKSIQHKTQRGMTEARHKARQVKEDRTLCDCDAIYAQSALSIKRRLDHT